MTTGQGLASLKEKAPLSPICPAHMPRGSLSAQRGSRVEREQRTAYHIFKISGPKADPCSNRTHSSYKLYQGRGNEALSQAFPYHRHSLQLVQERLCQVSGYHSVQWLSRAKHHEVWTMSHKRKDAQSRIRKV